MLLLIIFINLIGGKWPNMDLEKQSEIQPKYEDEETRLLNSGKDMYFSELFFSYISL